MLRKAWEREPLASDGTKLLAEQSSFHRDSLREERKRRRICHPSVRSGRLRRRVEPRWSDVSVREGMLCALKNITYFIHCLMLSTVLFGE